MCNRHFWFPLNLYKKTKRIKESLSRLNMSLCFSIIFLSLQMDGRSNMFSPLDGQKNRSRAKFTVRAFFSSRCLPPGDPRKKISRVEKWERFFYFLSLSLSLELTTCDPGQMPKVENGVK